MTAATTEMMESSTFKVDTNDEFEVYVKEELAYTQAPSGHLPFHAHYGGQSQVSNLVYHSVHERAT